MGDNETNDNFSDIDYRNVENESLSGHLLYIFLLNKVIYGAAKCHVIYITQNIQMGRIKNAKFIY